MFRMTSSQRDCQNQFHACCCLQYASTPFKSDSHSHTPPLLFSYIHSMCNFYPVLLLWSINDDIKPIDHQSLLSPDPITIPPQPATQAMVITIMWSKMRTHESKIRPHESKIWTHAGHTNQKFGHTLDTRIRNSDTHPTHESKIPTHEWTPSE